MLISDNATAHNDNASPLVDCLFFGDVVGKAGRLAVKTFLAEHFVPQRNTVVLANGENATHGFGLSENHYNELLGYGIDVLTNGNHVWDRKDIVGYIDNAERLLRPHNMASPSPGTGVKVFNFTFPNGQTVTLGVLNLIGQVFMGHYNSPWEALRDGMAELTAKTNLVFLDVHAEATGEKAALAYAADHLGASAFVGTHTHVQTADFRCFPNGMGFITDAGFNGSHDSIIGMDKAIAFKRLETALPIRPDVAESGQMQANAVCFTLNTKTGRCEGIQTFNPVFSAPAKQHAVVGDTKALASADVPAGSC